MKLISLHINGFGALSNIDYKFAPGLNSFFMANGVGKTTLSDFIFSMLYGMKETRSNSSEMGLRRHYLPFDNPGNYGGSLEIEVGDKRINIVRTFHPTRRGEDTLELYDSNGAKMPIPTDKSLGEMFFGIDEDSFKRTVLFSSISSNSKAGGTDSINRKLDMTVSDIDTKKLSEALEALDEQAKEIISPARARVHLGKVNILQDEVDNLTREIRVLEALEGALDEKYNKLNSIEAEIDSINTQIIEMQRLQREMLVWRQIDGLTDKLLAYDAEANSIKDKYPNGMPSRNDLDSLADTEKAINNAKATLEAAKNNASESLAISKLRDKYPKGMPDESLVAKLIQARKRLNEYNVEIAKLKNIGEDPNLEDDLHVCLEKAKMLNESKRQLAEADTQGAKTPEPKFMMVILVVSLGIAIALSAIGYGAIGFAVGVVGVGIYELLKYKRGKEEKKLIAENKSRIEGTINSIENDLRAFFSAHGVEGDNFDANVNEISSRLNRYRQLKGAANKIKDSINRLLVSYRINFEDIDSINSDRSTLAALTAKEAENEKRFEKFNYSLKLLEQRADTIFNRYGLPPKSDIRTVLDAINNDKSRMQYINDSKQEVYDNIERVKKENALGQRPDPTLLRSVDGLREQYKEAVIEAKRIENELNDDEVRLSSLSDLKEQVARKEQQIKTLTDEYNVIMLTKDFISKADISLKERYIAPIKNEYLKYMDKIGAPLGTEIVMDTDFKIKILVGGVPRDSRHLSDGQSTCLELCLRAALVDNMYKHEKPFLIFDDPFTDLDADNFSKISKMMQSLADVEVEEGYQILYFTCHEAREL